MDRCAPYFITLYIHAAFWCISLVSLSYILFMYLLLEGPLKNLWKNLSYALCSCSLQGRAFCWSPVIQGGLTFMFLGTATVTEALSVT
jgi:hypothetical protein